MFDLLSNNVIGLDIGTSSIKLVELEKNKNVFTLKNFGMTKLPRETVVNGVIINSEPLIAGIKKVLNNLKIKNKNVCVSVSGHPVIIKKVTIGLMEEDELEPIIEMESEQYIPFDLDEVNIDFAILGVNEEQDDQMDVLLVAAKKAMVDEYREVLSKADLKTAIIDIDVFAIENMFNINHESDEKDIFALVDIGASITNINILKGGNCFFNRDIFLGGNHITEEIQKELSMSYEEAENIKTGEPFEGINTDIVDEIITKGASAISREVQRALEMFSSTTYNSVTRIFLSGGGSNTKGLKEILEEKTGLPVEYSNPFKSIKYNKNSFDQDYINDISPFSAVVVGLASRNTED